MVRLSPCLSFKSTYPMGIVAFGWLAVQLGAKEDQGLHLVVDDEAGRFGARITLGSVRTDDAGGQGGRTIRARRRPIR
jgi:hypothetical protein